MYAEFYEEGDKCPEENCEGHLEYQEVENCSCHINPPCSSCTDSKLNCHKCGWKEEAPEYKHIPVSPGLSFRGYKPTPLDKTKIDYRIKMHSGSSQICEGVYPDWTTSKQVEDVVKGTFGGRFQYFDGGIFKYIAYTD